MKKKVYLIHCWSGNVNNGWYPWLKKHLNNNEIEVIMENMPNSDAPTINEWVQKLKNIVSNLDEETYFIAHSIGCQTLLRYLETKAITKIGGILFVAPWLDLLPDELDEESKIIAHDWINTPIDFDKIKKFTDNITCIFSTNDYFVSIEQAKKFQDKLNSKIVVVENKGHISSEDDVNELPEILIETGKLLNLELLEEVDEEGKSTGKILDRNIIHKNNLLHKEVGLFIINSKNQILLQKRAATKKSLPNVWAWTGGHVNLYEKPEDALIREVKEEIGFEVKEEDLKFLTKVTRNELPNPQVTFAYYTTCDKYEDEFVIQKEELSEVKWYDIEEFKKLSLSNHESMLFHNSKNFRTLLTALEEIIYKN